MQWELLAHNPQKPAHPVLQSSGILVKLQDQWMALPGDPLPETGADRDGTQNDAKELLTRNHPVLMLNLSELSDPALWSFLLRFVDRNIPALARFTESLEIEPDGLIRALGWKAHYRSRDEWKQWASLSEASEQLYLLYDFPLNVLRLWDRIDDASRSQWMDLWKARGFKKNLVKEIIQYYHDLSPQQRQQALQDALEFSANWKARSGIFPAEQIRDQLYRQRYPEISGLQEQVFQLQKALPGHKKLSYIIPDHLEAGHLDIRLRIESEEDLQELFQLVLEANRGGKIQELLKLIQ